MNGPRAPAHGEFTPHNVLWQGGRAVPIDWESAAFGAGEVDLAVLLDAFSRKGEPDQLLAKIQALLSK